MADVALIGAGRMGGAMARGWLADPARAGISRLHVVEPSPDPELASLCSAGPATLNGDAQPVDIVVLAVKPQSLAAAAPGLAGWIRPETLVLSIMAGLTLRQIGDALKVGRIVRAMPNTPGAIGQGVSAFALSSACLPADQAAAERLLSPLGKVIGPVPEDRMDAVTAVSGSGPAYVFLLAEALEAAGRAAGLEPQVAAQLARGTVAGAGALLATGEDPSALRRAVTSPGGTTAAALDVLMAPGGLPDLMRKAVEAAARRGAELSRGGRS
jgi:pyrroline-5-carboxylate reductase